MGRGRPGEWSPFRALWGAVLPWHRRADTGHLYLPTCVSGPLGSFVVRDARGLAQGFRSCVVPIRAIESAWVRCQGIEQSWIAVPFTRARRWYVR